MEIKFIEVAELTKPQGLKGETRALLRCDSPEVLENLPKFFLGEKKLPVKVILREVRKGFVVLKLENVNDIESAQKLAGEIIYADRNDFELEENEWFIADLIGLGVFDADTNKCYGKLDEIYQNAPKDVYSIRTPENKQLLFPAIPEVLIDVNLSEGKIIIRPLKGLFEEDGNDDDDDNNEEIKGGDA